MSAAARDLLTICAAIADLHLHACRRDLIEEAHAVARDAAEDPDCGAALRELWRRGAATFAGDPTRDAVAARIAWTFEALALAEVRDTSVMAALTAAPPDDDDDDIPDARGPLTAEATPSAKDSA